MILKALFLVSVIFSAVTAESLIDKWGRCKISDPNLNDCLSKACGNMVKDLKNGNAEHNIPSWDPFHIKDMHLKSGGNSPVNLMFDIEDSTMNHLTEFSDLKVDASQLKDYTFKMVLSVPLMNMTSKYKMNGKLLAVPIKGQGDMIVTMTKVHFELTLKGKPTDKGGKTYWEATNINLNIKPTKMVMKFTGMFGGDKKLGDATNKMLNDNWALMHKEFTPVISSEFQRTCLPIANAITQLEPFDEMFPK